MSSASIRRSPFVITYWENGTHQVHNYATQANYPATALVDAILDLATSWTARDTVGQALPQWERAAVDQAIDELVTSSMLEAADRPPLLVEPQLVGWGQWNPVAGFFHCATRVLPFEDGRTTANRVLVARAYPPVVKEYPDRPRTDLPSFSRAGTSLAELLLTRRTWREFGDRDLTLDEMAALLGLTFGVQRWLDLGDDRRVALKTSPSGGARHSIEAYLLAFGVEGLENGTYHYCPDKHALTLLDPPTPRSLLADFVPAQTGFHDAAAVIVMTSVFARMQWKYQHPRAYRVVLLDAGHLGQTFALVATSLGLAPFCTAAVNDPLIERHLGIDGIAESVVLLLGVGPRPSGKDWAPMHDHAPAPPTAPPAWSERFPT